MAKRAIYVALDRKGLMYYINAMCWYETCESNVVNLTYSLIRQEKAADISLLGWKPGNVSLFFLFLRWHVGNEAT